MQPIFINYNGVDVQLSSEDIERVYRAKAREYHAQDAKTHTKDLLENNAEIAACPWVLPIETMDGMFNDMAQEFEDRKDCNRPDNDTWDDIVEEYIFPFVNKNAAAYIMRYVTGDITIPDDTAWYAFVFLMHNYTRTRNDIEAAIINEAIKSSTKHEIIGTTDKKTLDAIQSALENGIYFRLLEFCKQHLPEPENT